MKSILEQALVSLLNEDHDTANELMHQFIVDRARSINESLREGEEDVEVDGPSGDQFFTEADLEDEEAVEQLTDDLGEDDAENGGFEYAEDDAGADAEAGAELDGEATSEASDLEAELEELRASIEELKAEFDALSDIGDDVEEEEAEAVDATVDAEASVEGEVVGDIEDAADADEFDDLTESMVDDLKKIVTPNTDGRGANGEKLADGGKSPIAKDAKPSVLAPKTKTPDKNDFDREKAPAVKAPRKFDNVRGKSEEGNSAIKAKTEKAVSAKSPISGKKSK